MLTLQPMNRTRITHPKKSDLPQTTPNVALNTQNRQGAATLAIQLPPLLPFDSIPEENRALICKAILQTYGFDLMRDIKVEAINHLVFGNCDDTYISQ